MSERPRVLIVGGAGQLGIELQRSFAGTNPLVKLFRRLAFCNQIAGRSLDSNASLLCCVLAGVGLKNLFTAAGQIAYSVICACFGSSGDAA